jgi:hypothetical protein
LKYPGKYKEYLLRKPIHGKCLVGSVPMKKKSLKEEGEIPVGNKENENDFHDLGLSVIKAKHRFTALF